MVAATPNSEANILICQLMSSYIGKKTIFRLWDNTDSWDKTKLSNHADWGRPLVFTATIPNIDDKIDTKINILKNKLSNTIIFDQKYYQSFTSEIPIFAINNTTLTFLTPDVTLSSGTEIIAIKLKDQ